MADAFAQAAGRAKEAGIDSVQLHAAHGFLMQQFMSPYTNQRKDRYGDRLAFLKEVVEKVKAVVGDDYPLGLRVSADEFLGDQGITIDDFVENLAPGIEKAGIHILVFAGVVHDHSRVLEGVRSVAGNTPLLGGSAFGEMTERGLEDGSVSLMALALGGAELSVGLGTQTDRDPLSAGEAAARSARDSLSNRTAAGRLGLLIAEMRANEQPLLGIQAALGADFPLFGGCCSGNRRAPITDPAFSQGYQYCNHQVHRHGVPLAMLQGEFATGLVWHTDGRLSARKCGCRWIGCCSRRW